MYAFRIRIVSTLFLLAVASSVFADRYPIDKRIDVKNYKFYITVSDQSNAMG